MSAAPPSLGPLPSQLSRVTIKWLSSPEAAVHSSTVRANSDFFSSHSCWEYHASQVLIKDDKLIDILLHNNNQLLQSQIPPEQRRRQLSKVLIRNALIMFCHLGSNRSVIAVQTILGAIWAKANVNNMFDILQRCLQMSWHSLVYRMLSPDLMSTPVSRGNGGLSRSREKSF